jgi:large subunit ribosomal protein L24
MANRKTLNIKKGDVVRVIAGKDKGAEGKVISVLSEQDRVIVEGVNRIKRHTKVVNQGGRGGTTGGIITQEAAVHVSKRRGDGSTYTAQRSVRVARKTGEEI